METKKNENTDIAIKLNQSVASVIGAKNLQGFEKAYAIANAAGQLKQMLTKEYMLPIMNLQGNRLGFKTDKDNNGGYSEDVVKNCLIEAVLFGLQPFGNQFNIIAGNMYATKEGCGYLLKQIEGLSYDIIAELPRMNSTSAAIVMNINWSINGISQSKKLDIPVKINQYMGTDAVIGKATRKARKWLYDTITGSELPEGDIADVDAKIINNSEDVSKEIERKRILDFIENSNDAKVLNDTLVSSYNNMDAELQDAFDNKIQLLTNTK
jgi:hypothetical protein